GRLADVPAAGAGRIEFDAVVQPGILQALAQHALGQRRAADVAQADDEQAQGLSHGRPPGSLRPARGPRAYPRPAGTARAPARPRSASLPAVPAAAPATRSAPAGRAASSRSAAGSRRG